MTGQDAGRRAKAEQLRYAAQHRLQTKENWHELFDLLVDAAVAEAVKDALTVEAVAVRAKFAIDRAIERARREERAEFNALLDKWEAAYPEAVFPPFTAVDHPHVSPDRIAAEMGRHMARELRKQLAGPPASAPEARCFPACYDDDRCSYPKCTASAPEGETK